ncbi:hypothetical protein GEMRC1_010756 [Eukaryota sp. GEM-RC1]
MIKQYDILFTDASYNVVTINPSNKHFVFFMTNHYSSSALNHLSSLPVDSMSIVSSSDAKDVIDAECSPLYIQHSVQQERDEKLVIDWNKLSPKLRNCYDQMVRNEATWINLCNNSIGPEGATAIAEALKLNSSVSWLNLDNNSLGNEGATAIADALKVNSSLCRITLGDNAIGNEGAIAIAEVLKVNSSLSEINLIDNSIGNEGATAIAEVLKVNSSVSCINLRHNSINSQTRQSLKSLNKNRIYF